MYFIIGGDGKQYGPVSADLLRQWVADGRLNHESRVMADGGQWQPLGAFPELATVTHGPATAGPVPAAPQKTSGLAIASLVLGILGFCTYGITALVGLILGIVSLKKIKRSNGTIGGRGLAIAGISVSGASFVFVGLLAAMLIPALSTAREKAKRVQCLSNLKQIGMAMAVYNDDNNQKLPVATQWGDLLKTYVSGSDKIYRCSSDQSGGYSYAFNANLSGSSAWQGPDSDLVVALDAPRGWNATVTGPADVPPSPHKDGYNVLFTDGHVEFVIKSRLPQLHWKPSDTR